MAGTRPEIEPAVFDLAARVAEVLAGADWVVTGEGCFDEQSLYGKVVAGVLAAAGRATVPVAVIAGSSTISRDRAPELGLGAREVSTPAGSSFRDSAHRAEELLTAAARRLADTAFRS